MTIISQKGARNIPKQNNEESNKLSDLSSITREELDRFKEIILTDYGLKLSDKQAYEQATALINLFETLIEEKINGTVVNSNEQ